MSGNLVNTVDKVKGRCFGAVLIDARYWVWEFCISVTLSAVAGVEVTGKNKVCRPSDNNRGLYIGTFDEINLQIYCCNLEI